MNKWELYKAGWRPMLGWISVLVIIYAFIVHPGLVWYFTVTGFTGVLPIIDAAALINLVAIIIGMGAMRTYEKMNKDKPD